MIPPLQNRKHTYRGCPTMDKRTLRRKEEVGNDISISLSLFLYDMSSTFFVICNLQRGGLLFIGRFEGHRVVFTYRYTHPHPSSSSSSPFFFFFFNNNNALFDPTAMVLISGPINTLSQGGASIGHTPRRSDVMVKALMYINSSASGNRWVIYTRSIVACQVDKNLKR